MSTPSSSVGSLQCQIVLILDLPENQEMGLAIEEAKHFEDILFKLNLFAINCIPSFTIKLHTKIFLHHLLDYPCIYYHLLFGSTGQLIKCQPTNQTDKRQMIC